MVPKWIQNKVIPAYTILSVAYCKSLPGTRSRCFCENISLFLLSTLFTVIILVCGFSWSVSQSVFVYCALDVSFNSTIGNASVGNPSVLVVLSATKLCLLEAVA